MSDPVDGLDAVANPDRVDTARRTGRADAGVDLQVKVTLVIASTGRVVPDGGSLDLLDRRLHLASPWPTRVVACPSGPTVIRANGFGAEPGQGAPRTLER